MDKTSTARVVYFVFANGMYERECATLRGAKLSARALARKGFRPSVMLCRTLAAGASVCEYFAGPL